MCLSCRVRSGPLCPECRRSLEPAPPTEVFGRVVFSAFLHSGAARHLVHRVKYDGSAAAARLLSRVLAPMLPAHASTLVPIPRAAARRWRLGVDGAELLARSLSHITGLTVEGLLVAPVWYRSHAGSGRAGRSQPALRSRAATEGMVLVDDVITTGATLRAAFMALPEAVCGVTATRSGGTSLFGRANDRREE